MSGPLWDYFVNILIVLFTPMVCSYHMICTDLLFNVSATDAKGLEKVGNVLLTPTHYLFAGREAIPKEEGTWEFQQRFEYETAFWEKTIASAIALPLSLVLGGACKTIALVSAHGKARYASLLASQNSTQCSPNSNLYTQLGIWNPSDPQWLTPQGYTRRPEDLHRLDSAKELLKEIAQIFNESGIPWWVNCGTCLGTYRYGGVIPWDEDIDIAILLPDFENARKALNRLDPKKYQVQNWSGRSFPNTFLKVFIKQTACMIDIDCFTIDFQSKQLQCIFSLDNAIFFPEWVKIRERRFSEPAPFSMMFPLKKATFDGIEVFVPNQTEPYLQRCYGENLAPAKVFNPQTNQYEPDLSHPYWQRKFVH